MARADVHVLSGAYVDQAETISTEFFGGNLLFDRDKVGAGGTYDEKAAALNLGLIRYPGGNVTELFFDLSNPEKRIEPDGRSGELMPLSEFLAYAKGAGVTASFVAPTVPFMDALATGAKTKGAIKREMKTFLKDLKAGKYGDPSVIEHIEIGNEYYGYDKHYDWSAIDMYAEIAPLWAEAIRQVLGKTVKISVQGGVNAEENAVLLDVFAGRGDVVDSVIYHSYPWDLGQVYSHDDWKSWLWDQWVDRGIAESVFVSEWGVSNQRIGPDGEVIGSERIEDGMARAVAMIEKAALMIRSGVDFATVWPVQQNTRGDLAGDEGQTADSHGHVLSDNGLTLAGEAFRLMSEALPGARMLDIGGPIDLDGRAETARYEAELLVRAFEDAEKIVVFASAWALDDAVGLATLNLDFTGIERVDIATLTVAGSDYTSPNIDPVLFEETGLDAGEGLTLTFTRDYEIKRVILHKEPGAALAGLRPDVAFDPVSPTLFGDSAADLLIGDEARDGIWGFGGADTLIGDAAGDHLEGGRGADRLFGQDGFDFLNGGGGADYLDGGLGGDSLSGAAAGDHLAGRGGEDTLRGGGGADTLKGGRQGDVLFGGGGADVMKGDGGDDVLRGGGGRDQLFGGRADDTLLGGGGADTLTGGGGDDVLFGGAGADVFIILKSEDSATISDFRSGVDRISIAHADDFSDLAIRATDAGVRVSAGGAVVEIEGADRTSLNAGDFIL